jgi:MFS family permease
MKAIAARSAIGRSSARARAAARRRDAVIWALVTGAIVRRRLSPKYRDGVTDQRAPRLFTPPYVAILAIFLLGFTVEGVVRAVVPIVILSQGGGALEVGLFAAASAIPSLILRPWIGRLVDQRRSDDLVRVGAGLFGAVPLLFVLPGVFLAIVVRLLHGVGWAIESVAAMSVMAKVAPPARRGEASGYMMAMPAIGTLIGPAAGIAAYSAFGETAAIALAVALGLAAFAISVPLRVPSTPQAERPAGPEGVEPGRWIDRFIEPSALPASAMVTATMALDPLFLVFAPVYVAMIGAPVEVLALYYPAYGIVLAVSQLVAGRASDRLGRLRAVRIGSAIGIAGFAVALVVGGIEALFVASFGYAIALALISPTLSALTIDLAPPGRVGVALATYTTGYQVGKGGGGILWGAVIGLVGLPWPFVLGLGLHALTIGLSLLAVPGRPAAGAPVAPDAGRGASPADS